MRKHKIRHILHGLLDLLPLFVIPVFMVYSHRHAIDNYSVTVDGAYYQLEQGVINGKPNENLTNVSTNADSIRFQDDSIYIVSNVNSFNVIFNCNIELHYNDIIFYSFEIEPDATDTFNVNLSIGLGQLDDVFQFDFVGDSFTYYNHTYSNENYEGNLNYIEIYSEGNNTSETFTKKVQVFNLTSIFGSGNEPTADEFSSMIGDTYYEYGQTYNVFLPFGTTTYNATDIGSQFVYSLYNATVNYFNTDSVFNLGSLHNWITNNFFNGNMPLGVTVVYHVIVYELIMDIIFLIYAVFMFIVDFASDFLEHCFTWSRRGGN